MSALSLLGHPRAQIHSIHTTWHERGSFNLILILTGILLTSVVSCKLIFVLQESISICWILSLPTVKIYNSLISVIYLAWSSWFWFILVVELSIIHSILLVEKLLLIGLLINRFSQVDYLLLLDLLILSAAANRDHSTLLLVKVEAHTIGHVHFVGVPIKTKLCRSFLFFIRARDISFGSRILLLVQKLTLNLGPKLWAIRGHAGLGRVDRSLNRRN